MRYSRRPVLVDERAGREPLERERRVQLVRLAVRKGPGEAPARAGGRLETARSPATVDEEPVDGGRADDGRRVGADVDDARPRAQDARVREDREELERGGELMLDHVERAALRVRRVR